jgi:uncharacterized protein YlbG (UPF0298 family)
MYKNTTRLKDVNRVSYYGNILYEYNSNYFVLLYFIDNWVLPMETYKKRIL